MNFRIQLKSAGIVFFALITMCNIHLVLGTTPSSLMYFKGPVRNGEIWRLFTHVFVHLSWYHLILDVAAVVMLWVEISERPTSERLFLVCCCGIGSLAGAAFFSPLVDQTGFCGLSGVAHGMMCVVGLLWATHDRGNGWLVRHYLGIVVVLLSVGKSLHEVLVGNALLASIHSGHLGVPIVQSHFGGVVGGASAFVFLGVCRRIAIFSQIKTFSGNQAQPYD